MAEICARVGGSKATLYNHFSSKDELFFEVMSRLCEEEFSAMLERGDITLSLNQFGQRFLHFIYSPDVQSNQQLIADFYLSPWRMVCCTVPIRALQRCT
ncbi:hypothetical protein SB6421_04562 [Klebsiella huaxiensis]|uniref:TetR/AcrR family transcriptional regulator n=1 Tax=Klebsiella huaxiensis TaxID=2153354 RepID=UPI00116A5424|nr:TetR/AcrR family transcriptional regulator [Klebsiella huaxiensis]VUS70642.1 hypothetical protein SB6425_03701 [Klebsiella huaxiensis]VUT03652.1 hypothetical protein SB6421_04562 [Klebsiella huaxiensis]